MKNKTLIDFCIIFSKSDQQFYIHVKKYEFLKHSKIILSDSLCLTHISNLNEIERSIKKNKLIERITPEYIYYENPTEIKYQKS
jgi:hypothetical protein